MLKNMKQILRRAFYNSSMELCIPICSLFSYLNVSSFKQQIGKTEGLKSVVTGITRILSALHFNVN
jgi:hypothetical protein